MNPEQTDNLVHTHELLTHAGIADGMTVVDCGAGAAAPFTLAAAELVGDAGHVFALDVVKDVLAAVKQRAEARGFMNVEPVWTDLEIVGAAKRVANNMADMVVISDTLSQSRQKDQMLAEAYRMLKSGGRLLVVDWKPGATGMGPIEEHRLDSSAAQLIAEQIGMAHVETFDAGDYHWALVMQK